jgi:hypothetical protein
MFFVLSQKTKVRLINWLCMQYMLCSLFYLYELFYSKRNIFQISLLISSSCYLSSNQLHFKAAPLYAVLFSSVQCCGSETKVSDPDPACS